MLIFEVNIFNIFDDFLRFYLILNHFEIILRLFEMTLKNF